jgi:ectoine hydroxylase-related dioxygenase (phytanoyl-CoA dioxygenase family)
MDPVDELLTTYDDQGYVILRDVLDAKQVEATRAALAPYLELELSGRNNFEGERTQRVYSLVGRGREFEHSAEHPRVLEILDRLLQPGYLQH